MLTSLHPGLYVVATPIGHLGDISARARDVLQQADCILCEDTRQTKKLLNHYEFHATNQRLICANEHTERSLTSFITEEIQQGKIIALVSDAGTPGICDPGFPLIQHAHLHKLPVIPVPGPSALTTFLSCIGAHPQPIYFVGFFPKKEQAILDRIAQYRPEDYLLVFLESPQRIAKTVRLLQQELPSSTPCYIGRELTKLYEQIWTGTLDALAQAITEETIPQRGEFIVGLSLSKSTSDRWQEAALSLVQDLGVKKTSLWISEHFEVRKNQVYDFLTEVNRLK